MGFGFKRWFVILSAAAPHGAAKSKNPYPRWHCLSLNAQ